MGAPMASTTIRIGPEVYRRLLEAKGEKAIALEPNSANYHALLGIAFLFLGSQTEDAIKELKIANDDRDRLHEGP